MMRPLQSIAIVLPGGLAAAVALMLSVGMIDGFAKRLETINRSADAEIKNLVAQLAQLADYAMHSDAQLLFDHITQRATDRRVKLVAAADDLGTIIFSTDFSRQGRPLSELLPARDASLIDNAYNQRAAVVKTEGDTILAFMSFPLPPKEGELRSRHKGLVFALYDLSEEKSELALSVVEERWMEIAITLLALAVSIGLLNRHVVKPLSRLRTASQHIASGQFHHDIVPCGPTEIREVTQAFNRMAKTLEENILALERQSRHTQTIIDNVVDGIITISAAGLVVSLNKAAEDIFRYHDSEIIGTPVSRLIPDLGASRNLLSTPSDRELLGRRKNGDEFPLEMGIAEINDLGAPLYVAVIRDITDRKKVEKLKDDFISNVSHELRTPLTVINGAISLLQSGVLVSLPEQARELVHAAKRNSDRLLYLVNDLLDMEKILAGQMAFHYKNVALAALLRDAAQVNEIYGKERHIRLLCAEPVPDCRVRADPDRLQQIISNFLSNAFKFSHENGTVELGATLSGDSVRIFVRDEGEGIPAEFHPRIFAKFSQADSAKTRNLGGTGLGLAISKELITRMNGTIGFQSQSGVGSTFYVELPVCRAATPPPA
jgi:PAS domain S-box-containing protein